MLNPTPENTDHFINKGVYRTGKLTVRSIKLYADGALGSRGALLKEPYSDDPLKSGLQVTSVDEFHRICSLAYEKGYQVNTHCIGDSAVRLVLGVYSRYLKGKNNLRWRIEHSQVVDPSDFSLYGQYSVVPSVQATHATSDMYWAEERLGPTRIKYAYAYKSLLQQNGWLANGSDFPVEAINPLYGFYAATIRKDLNGFPEGGYRMEEAIGRAEALQAMTLWASQACMEEKETGSLEPGKMADFVILDRDILTTAEAEIPGTRVLATYVGGEKMYEFNE
jgi:predicted amidohydrolase YtcJ